LSDPLTQIVGLLQPSAWYSKVVEGAAAWRVRRSETGRPFYCVILAGECRLQVRGQKPITLASGDFVLIPSVFDFAMSSIEPMLSDRCDSVPIELRPGLIRLGSQDGPPEVRVLLGYCTFGSPDATLLVSLLPQLIHVRGDERLTTLLQLVNQESRASRLGRDVILARLVEVLLIEALRSNSSSEAPAGLLRGLADERLAGALRQMHDRPTWPWTVRELAKEAALSRTSFFERFRRAVGLAPMEYLLHWRMALAKDLLRRNVGGVAEIAQRVGYSSASTFSVAFARHVGLPPTIYAREQAATQSYRRPLSDSETVARND
jgi:AraC-like DNA-binding protein